MILSYNNPVYNAIIVFSVIMLLIYITKPDAVYDNNKHKFRQYGTIYGKTILPIYVVGILLAIIIYVFFHHLSLRHQQSELIQLNSKHDYLNDHTQGLTNHNQQVTKNEMNDNKYQHVFQQQQIQHLQNQMNQIIQQQMNSQIQYVLQNGAKQIDSRTLLGNQILTNDMNN